MKSVEVGPCASQQIVPAGGVREISSQGSSEFTAKWKGNRGGTRGSLLNTVIFIRRLNLAAASSPAAVYSSRIMDTVP